MNKIIKGNCIEKLKELPSNSVDAIVTDPPYGLGFMGKNWDYGVPGKVFFIEMIRLLKPGGFLLSFGGTRTYHRLVCGIEDAGFEIRDTIMWLYGSGFPKSLNIGKQVDKIKGNDRKVLGEKIRGDVEKAKQNGVTYAKADANKNNKDIFGYGKEIITKGNSDWEGWGTALKPACEPIVVARKPLSEKNVALNVLKWGTGGINIDACRVEHNEPLKETNRSGRDNAQVMNSNSCGFDNIKNTLASASPNGRFPANIILDEEAGEMLDKQSVISESKPHEHNHKQDTIIYGGGKGLGIRKETSKFNDKGGASRFFYCAKASKSERNFGCEELKEQQQDLSRKEGNPGGDNPRNRGVHLRKNNHPTVKPIKLMEYLIKLISREGATILDPFGGSGTTAIACLKLNRFFILIEKESEYINITNARIKPYLEQTKL